MLETRLDACVLRAGLTGTIYAARQYVSHEHFQVKGVKVKEGSLSQAVPPVYLQVSKDELKARLVSLPKREEIPVECDLGQVIEFYSR